MTSVMPDNTPPPPPASVQASSTGLAPGTANQNHHLQYMPQRRTPPPSSPTPTHPRPSSPLAATYTAIHIDAPLLNQHQTTLELYDTWALSLKPKRPSFIQNAMGFVKSFVSIITSDGSKVGIKVQDPAIQLRDEDAIMRRNWGNKLSIWTIMRNHHPIMCSWRKHVKMYKDEFRRTYGHHILLERF
ncbi:hypothetical protein BC829DRAFT_197029 [Chytridium lagenaria]|nr:hypothetical protein BC829DRAFT_197029 [Chytridium lagenaria]